MRGQGRSFSPQELGQAVLDWWKAGGMAGSLGMQPVDQAIAERSRGLGEALLRGQAPQESATSLEASPMLNAFLGGAIKAFHGTPHSFTKFDMSKVGTGEGAQAYGHGLYFAGKEGTARYYRDKTAKPDPEDMVANAYDLVQLSGGDVAEAAETVRGALRMAAPETPSEATERLKDTLEAIESGAYESYQPPGNLYRVNIDAEADELLDWDLPLSKQSEKAKAAVLEVSPEVEGRAWDSIYIKDVPKEMAEKWKAAGIKGIKYLDQGSRAAGEGTHNYVIFDDALIDILTSPAGSAP